MDMHQPLDGPLRMERERERRELEEAIADIRAMVPCWWREPEKKLPPKPEKYVVVVEEGGMAYLTTRSWSGTDWLNMRPAEKVTEWLEGLLMPADIRTRQVADRRSANG